MERLLGKGLENMKGGDIMEVRWHDHSLASIIPSLVDSPSNGGDFLPVALSKTFNELSRERKEAKCCVVTRVIFARQTTYYTYYIPTYIEAFVFIKWTYRTTSTAGETGSKAASPLQTQSDIGLISSIFLSVHPSCLKLQLHATV